jgi:geranylgeranyl pyrophosphate synthase
MVHAASLLHDDIIDEAYLRRGSPTFWAKKGISGAILLGDLLVCKALLLLNGKDESRQNGLLIRLAAEMCDAEAEQELITSGTVIDLKKCADIARRKTGSLFAFAASAGASAAGDRADAILEAGYRLGTAYQLADDLMDASGDATRDGKDLGKDSVRGTAIADLRSAKTSAEARTLIKELCHSSSEMLSPWPEVKLALDEYLKNDFAPVVSRFIS